MMWKTESSGRYSRLWGLRLAGWQSGSTIAPVPLITSASLPSGTRSAPPPMPPRKKPSVFTMLVRWSYAISGRNWMTSDLESNTPNGPDTDTERSAADVARGLEEVVKLNRLQFEAFAALRRDLEHLTERVRQGNLLLLPRSPHPRKRKHP
jgi:hypothetical protein